MKKLLRAKALCLVLMGLMLVTACSKPQEVKGFDRAMWKADPQGCKGQRAQVWQSFAAQKANLLGYSENDLGYLLGPPDAKNLQAKGQKTYSYYVTGAPSCQAGQRAQLLQVRVNVTGNVSEVLLIHE